MNVKKYSVNFAGEKLEFTIGKMAEQANGAVLAQWGETVVLATCVMSGKEREGIDFFPLSVDFEERLYAAGRIKQNRFMKREGKPTDEAILAGRMIDRAIRPRFNHSLRREIQVVVTALSLDETNNVDILGLNAASLALMISDIPWEGPVTALRCGLNEKRDWKFSPSHQEQKEGQGNLVLAVTENKINMIECEGKEINEPEMMEAIDKAASEIKKLTDLQKKIAQELGKKKQTDIFCQPNEKITALAQKFLKNKITEKIFDKKTEEGLEEIKKALFEEVAKEAEKQGFEERKSESDALAVYEELLSDFVHQKVLRAKKRIDGRDFDEIRELDCEISVLPRTHGSAIFKRGQTQTLSIVTLGAPSDKLLLDGMETAEETKSYFHHYNFLPFSTGEVKRLGSPNRREIGHGTLAEKALQRMIPKKDSFPYTIRVVSEILSSNGSSSMASTCGSTLALLDAGVPIEKPVAGIALGLISDGKNHEILTDIQGPEDHYGDMDLKIAGTKDGITAIQMDVKIEGVTKEILAEALVKAKKARLFILDKMAQTIPVKKELSPWAPRIFTMQINPDKIKDVIGPGGKIINNIIDETGVTIDIEDSGLVFITSPKQAPAEKAREWIENLTREVQPGEIFKGKISRILNFGAFAEILPNQEGLIHISERAPYRVEKVDDIVKVGDIVPVKVKNIDEQGRINLSLKEAAGHDFYKQKPKPKNQTRPTRHPSAGNKNNERRPGSS